MNKKQTLKQPSNRPITRYFTQSAQIIEQSNKTMDLPAPGFFHGRPEEDAASFLDTFSLWADTKALTPEIRLASFKLILREKAAAWRDSINNINNYAELINEFKKRYIDIEAHKYKISAKLWNSKQETGEAGQDYIARVRTLASKVNLGEENIIMILINGLKPTLKSFIIRSQPTTMADLTKQIILFESSEEGESSISDLAKNLNEIKISLAALSNNKHVKFDEESSYEQPQNNLQIDNTHSNLRQFHSPSPSRQPYSPSSQSHSRSSSRRTYSPSRQIRSPPRHIQTESRRFQHPVPRQYNRSHRSPARYNNYSTQQRYYSPTRTNPPNNQPHTFRPGNSRNTYGFNNNNNECFSCGQYGHIRKYCNFNT